MATFRKRPQSDGTVSHQAIIRIKRKGEIIHQESQTFPLLALAKQWARDREVALAHPGALERAREGDVSLGSLIKWYRENFESLQKWGRTKKSDLAKLEKHDIAKVNALTFTSQFLIDHVRKRRTDGAGPVTALNDLVWIGVVLRAAKAVKGIPVEPDVVSDARRACHELRLVGKSKRRDRLPTTDELMKLDAYWARADGRMQVPMRHIMWFALYSTRRESEITRLLRSDDDERGTGMVRDAKHPREKEGNHRRFKYTPAAKAIADLQPRIEGEDRIFPYDHRSISAAFTRACKYLDIKGLVFHDLRHEGTTRLFECGLTIPEVAAHTLHESWAVLKRYTHLVGGKREVCHAPFLPAEKQRMV